MKNLLASICKAFATLALFCGVIVEATGQEKNLNPQLDAAIRDGDPKRIKAALAQGANINAKDDEGTTPLMDAVVNSNAACVKLLLDHGADPNAGNNAGATALMWAVGDLEKVQLLLAKGAAVNAISKEKKSPLLLAAARKNSLPVVKALLDKGADVNYADKLGGAALSFAASSGDVEMMKLLLAHGADPKAKTNLENSVLNAAAGSRNIEAVKLLLELGASVKDARNTILIQAVNDGPIEMSRLLLAKGAEVNVADQFGYTPLIHAVLTENSSLELIKLLLDHGADANAKAKDGFTALSFAKRKGWSAAVALLTQSGAKE